MMEADVELKECTSPIYKGGKSSEHNHSEQAKLLEKFEHYRSFDYLPSNSAVYRSWLKHQPARGDWDRWIMMSIIGISVGLVGVLLHQAIHAISHYKWHQFEHILHAQNLPSAWLFALGFSVGLVFIGSAIVVFVHLPAGGSGMPEVISFLNGTVQRNVLNLKTFVVKFLSCACVVGAGMPVGPEGPMIHMGSIAGSGLSQFRSQTLHITLPLFTRFRNSVDRRDFTLAGAACGVAAAFKSPVGGLLFAMEEVASFWNLHLMFMILFACMLATTMADLLNSSFDSFSFKGDFGQFHPYRYVVFKLGRLIPSNVLMFVPAVILGLVGGLLGGVFTIINLNVARLRIRFYPRIKILPLQQLARITEPVIIVALWTTICVFLPLAFPCQPIVCPKPGENFHDIAHKYQEMHPIHSNVTANMTFIDLHDDHGHPGDQGHQQHSLKNDSHYNNNPHHRKRRSSDSDGHGDSNEGGDHGTGSHHEGLTNNSLVYCPQNTKNYMIDAGVHQHMCASPLKHDGHIMLGEYNEAASLVNLDGANALRLLYSRHTYYQFGYLSLLLVLPVYYLLAACSAGSAIASGLFVPMLFIGALYGRALGRAMVDVFGVAPDDAYWAWIDPGAMALVGSASFLAGLSRLSISAVVIMVEITLDTTFTLPMMVAIMVAKWVADNISHSLYHLLMEAKHIPYLASDPHIIHKGKPVRLDLFTAADVMSHPPVTVRRIEAVDRLADLLLHYPYSGFPVLHPAATSSSASPSSSDHQGRGRDIFCGLITRDDLCCILCDPSIQDNISGDTTISPTVNYDTLTLDRVSVHRNPFCKELDMLLNRYINNPHYKTLKINLAQYINRSAPIVKEDFSLHRTYVLFRTMGLRHLCVIDPHGEVKGIIARKDLMEEILEEKMEEKIEEMSGYQTKTTKPPKRKTPKKRKDKIREPSINEESGESDD